MEAVHLDAASDVEQRKYAFERGCVLVSKDEDFLYLVSRTEPARSPWDAWSIAAPAPRSKP